ncbi:hypothetical protein [uncultured Mucilaginibacter sp.]|uniref:hypothetical protein n=1 Tax=uncultured Mucilaginibacter sp. TaxID=797541 RepID=UPI0025EF4F4F|nr:hypothetical protein [uncultured Mucilaginibacter sp.]
MKKIFLLSALLMCIIHEVRAQNSQKQIDSLEVENKAMEIRKVNSVKTGLANDLLTNFYQLTIKDVFGNKKQLSYSSTIFGLLKLNAQDTSKYTNDADYLKYRWARNIQLSVSGKLDSNNNVASFGGGIKFYLLNKRDITKRDNVFQQHMRGFVDQISRDFQDAIGKISKSGISQKKFDVIMASKEKYNLTLRIMDLDSQLIDTLKSIHSKIVFGNGLADSAKNYFNQQIKVIKNRPLWSLAGTYLHSIQNTIDTATIQSDFLVGLRSKTNNFWEFNASTYFQSYRSKLPQTSPSQKFHFETGFNRILHENTEEESDMELKFFGSYDKSFNTTTIPTAVKANLTYRYLVSRLGGFWIPVTLSYDPDKGKLFGFIDLTFNIDPKN